MERIALRVVLGMIAATAVLWLLGGAVSAAPSDDAVSTLTRPSVSAGFVYSCGVRTDGTVACWGNNSFGQATPPAGTFIHVSTGSLHTCGVRTDGTVACWGATTSPAGTFTQVSAGHTHTCGVRTDGTVACWGNNGSGEATPPGGAFLQVSAGNTYTCGVRSDGTVACWGRDFAGVLSPPGGTFTQISAGDGHICGVRTNGTLACWGDNVFGQATPPGGVFTLVSAGGIHTCGVRNDGTVACWGNNGSGRSTPPGGAFTQVSAGLFHTCGVRTDGTVACWGENTFGASNPAITSAAPAGGLLGVPYTHQFTTTFESPAPTFQVTAGSLPPGITLSASGLLSGTPTTLGSFDATVCASNGLAPPACQSFTIVIAKATPTISTQASPGGPLGTAVTDTATVSGGSSPTGTVTFKLFRDDTCTIQVGATSTKTLTGGSATSDPITPSTAGTYNWTADYSGDANNNAVSRPAGPPTSR